MHQRRRHGRVAPPGSTNDPGVGTAPGSMNLSLEGQVQNGLNLFLKLKSPAQMPALLTALNAIKDKTHAGLESIHYVHFARFLPSQDFSTLMVITAYDGKLDSYALDFVVMMAPAFNTMLMYVDGAPRLPVERYPIDFINWVHANNNANVNPWCAYPAMTVIQILRADANR